MQEINVEKIMEEIRADIKAKGYKASDLSFNDIPLKTKKMDVLNVANDINVLNTSWNLNYFRNLGNGLKGFVKRIIRKIMKPVLYDLFVQESLYNAACTRTICNLNQRIEELEVQLKNLEKK